MPQITKHFRLEEFAVSRSYPRLVEPVPAQYVPAVEFLARKILQPIRDQWGWPMLVTSGYRSDALNKAVKGSPTSQHRLAQAADITTAWIEDLFLSLIMIDTRLPMGQVIYYPGRNFIHIAVPSKTHPISKFQVQAPTKGIRYQMVTTVAEAQTLIKKAAA